LTALAPSRRAHHLARGEDAGERRQPGREHRGEHVVVEAGGDEEARARLGGLARLRRIRQRAGAGEQPLARQVRDRHRSVRRRVRDLERLDARLGDRLGGVDRGLRRRRADHRDHARLRERREAHAGTAGSASPSACSAALSSAPVG
jgi:hypothetical protein